MMWPELFIVECSWVLFVFLFLLLLLFFFFGGGEVV